MKQNIGFIGFGNMAQAMADGMLASGIVKGEQLYACARQWDKLCRNTEVRGMHANMQLIWYDSVTSSCSQ